MSWGFTHHWLATGLANSLAPERGKLLDKVYDLLDSAVLPEVVDELGMSGDLGGGFRGGARLHNFAEVCHRLRTCSFHHLQQPFPLIPASATVDAGRDLVDGSMGHAPQDFREAIRKARAA